MNNEKKKLKNNNFNVWLANLSYIAVVITLILIMLQIFYAKRTMDESSEWEKAKMTIENVERFKENLTKTKLYGTDALYLGNYLFPDFTTPEGNKFADTLRTVYYSMFADEIELQEGFQKIFMTNRKLIDDVLRTFDFLDAFAYPIIMGYASEMGSYQMVVKDYYSFSNFIMPDVLGTFQNENLGKSAKLLYRLWRVRIEQTFIKNINDKKIIENSVAIEEFTKSLNRLWCFEGTEVTTNSLKVYEKKLDKELKKIQTEIAEFRKSNLK